MSRETLLLLRQMLGNQTLTVGADDFPATARAVIAALEELDAALGVTAAAPPPCRDSTCKGACGGKWQLSGVECRHLDATPV